MGHLPLEICHMVVLHLSDDKQTLRALLLVSKNFLNEGARMLYKTILVRQNHVRNRLPLSNPIKRMYYGSLVQSLTIEPRYFYHNSIRPILVSTVHLKELHLLDHRRDNNVLPLLRTDYAFRLEALTVHTRFSEKLLSFFRSQPGIRKMEWNPIESAVSLPASVEGEPVLPELMSLKTSSTILNSPWFDSQRTVRHLWLAMPAWQYVNFDHRQTEVSCRVTSIRFPLGASVPYVNRLMGLFPRLRYLDLRHMCFADMKTALSTLTCLKKLWILLLDHVPSDVFAKCPSLESLISVDKVDCRRFNQYLRDGEKLPYSGDGDQEWTAWY